MPQEKKLSQPQQVTENPDAKIKRLEEENQQLRALAEKAINENAIMKATIKALSNLI